MDRCEELAAEYGMSPFDVLKWPWSKLECLWQSCAKRQRRQIKLEAMGQGHDIYGIEPKRRGRDIPADAGHDPAAVTSTLRRLEEWPNAPFSQGLPETYYMAPGANERAPTEADNWDVPEPEVNALAMWDPAMVQIVKGTYPTS